MRHGGPWSTKPPSSRRCADGWIAGAGLDVFEEEPTVHPGLLGLTNVVLAPHIASASHDTRLKMATLAVDNCLAVLEGKMPPTPVNPEVLARARDVADASWRSCSPFTRSASASPPMPRSPSTASP